MIEPKRLKILGLITVIVFLILLFRSRNHNDNNIVVPEVSNTLTIIYAITPTYKRGVQKAELTRLGQTLLLAPNVHWILIEDAKETSKLVDNLLRRLGLSHRSTQLCVPTPTDFKMDKPNWQKPRGVEQRNIALQWLRDNVPSSPYKHSIVFFMDDDNTYSAELFNEMNKIEPGRVGVWPVGLVGGLMVEKPILNKNTNEVIGFNSQWRPERPFPIDMAGFAISLDLILQNPEAMFSFTAERGYQESVILGFVTTRSNLQALANGCTEVLVWHTRTEEPKLGIEKKLNEKNIHSDAGMEV